MFTRKIMIAALLIASMGVGTGAVFAHHGWSGYDSSQTLNLTGVIREAGYEHPHAYIKLEVSDKDWLVILAPPSRMERRGMPRDTLRLSHSMSISSCDLA